MRFFYGNKATPGQLTWTTGSSSQLGYPASNVTNPHKSVVWRTGTSSASENIVFTFPAAVTVSSVMVLNHTIVNGSDTLKIQAHTSDTWTSPTVDQSLTVATDISHVFGSSQTYRYWRLLLTKASAGVSRSVGIVYLGLHYDTPHQPDHEGYHEEIVDPSRSTRTPGGQVYSEVLPKYREISTDFSSISQTFKASLDTVFESAGTTNPIGVQVETSGTLTKLRYCKFSRAPRFRVSGFDADLIWDTSLDFEELL